jgi:hypothetical protein
MDMQLDEVRELGELWKYESYRPNTASPPSLGSRSDLLQEDLGDSPVASARGVAPSLRERDSDSDCLRLRRRFFPVRGSDLLRPPTTIGHRPGLSRMPAVCRRRSDAVRLWHQFDTNAGQFGSVRVGTEDAQTA